VPVLAGLTDVCAGFRHTCAADGRAVWCWGAQLFGAVGDGSMAERRLDPVLVAIPGGRDVDDVSCTADTTCVRATDGTVWCWGNNGSAVAGPPAGTVRRAPFQIEGLTDAVAVAAGDVVACALRETGEIACWGQRAFTGTGTTAVAIDYPPTTVISPTE
jgi:alpha-tubulin suppressor-like RCC1 family protein